ncbi:MAG: amidohydrolase family protein [Sedimenticolaceae bacterium]
MADYLFSGGLIYDGDGSEPFYADVAVKEDRIIFVGDAAKSGVKAQELIDVTGLMVAPGFIDMHSHAELDEDYGRDALPFLYQGITTVLIGMDGGGTSDLIELYTRFSKNGIGVNVLSFVGHNAARRLVMGMDNRKPDDREMNAMKNFVQKGLVEGALGLSSGLFYYPGFYAETEEVIALNRVAAEYDGIYDTHDRDLGATYKGIGYLNSIKEAIRIGEEAGTPVLFSHFNAQGAHNYGRAREGAKLIEDARSRGVQVWAAQHVYTATQSNLRSYTIPGWAAAGGQEAMVARFNHPDIVKLLDVQTMEMLAIRGGAEKLLFGDPRPALNGKTLAQVSEDWGLPVPATVRKILSEANAVVMNLDLYDIDNTRYLARKPWMMTCTDGRTPKEGQKVVHPRVYGSFSRKIAQFVLDENLISMPFAIRSMTGLAADFLGLPDRGYLRKGMKADIAILDQEKIRDRATYQQPHQYSDGTVHVLVNGKFAIRDSKHTGQLSGRPLLRGGAEYGGSK